MDATNPRSVQGDAPAHYQQVDGRALQALARRRLAFGGLWLLAGVLITVLSYQGAAGGGVYVVAYGPMIYGAFRVVQGLWTTARRR